MLATILAIPAFPSCLLLPLAAAAFHSESALLVVPNHEGILDAAAAVQTQTPEAMPNPFKIRWRPPPTIREWQVMLSGVLIGKATDEACVCLNGGLYGRGEQCEGWTIAAISADGIELSKNGLRLQVPVQDTPVTIRLAF